MSSVNTTLAVMSTATFESYSHEQLQKKGENQELLNVYASVHEAHNYCTL